MKPARYFPVEPKPFSMRAGLIKFPTDFGNAVLDRQVFQADEQLSRYLAGKRAQRPQGSYFLANTDEAERAALDGVLRWVRARLADEAPERLAAADADAEARDPWDALGRALQEDLVVMHEGDGDGRALLLHVSFPSGWRPEQVVGAGFLQIHEPVPAFPGPHADPKTAVASRSMVRSMVERGPYVRFVWTVRADAELDHHPDRGQRAAWTASSPGVLRLERQLTWPFPELRASLFVIRTYLRPFVSLDAEERKVLAAAVSSMPEELKDYKGIPSESQWVLAALERS